MGMSQADNSVKNWRNLPISNPKPDLHNINAYTKFGENPLMFTRVIIRKQKTDGRTDSQTTDGRTDGLTDDQRETIKPRHYCVAGYNDTRLCAIMKRKLAFLFSTEANNDLWYMNWCSIRSNKLEIEYFNGLVQKTFFSPWLSASDDFRTTYKS